jgi:hypothetical protein
MSNIKLNMKNDSLYDLLSHIKNERNIENLLKNMGNKSEQGYLYEKLWDLVIKLGFISEFDNENIEHYYGNMNNYELTKINNLEHYLKNHKILSKNEGGSSDITFFNNKTKKWVFISSKNLIDTRKNKSIKSYEIQDILACIEKNKHLITSYEIYLIIYDKRTEKKVIFQAKSTNDYIKKNISQIFDFNDLKQYYELLYNDLQNINIESNIINDKYNKIKLHLFPKFHQQLIVHKTMEKINNNQKNILWGWKCRSGKTFGIGHLIETYFDKYNYTNALIITPAPSETLSQFTSDMFLKYRNFQNFNIIDIKNGNELKNIQLKKNNIMIVSKQLLDNYVEENRIQKIIDLNLNMIIFDENHLGGTTNKSHLILETYGNENTVNIFLTATYNKPIHKWHIEKDCQFFWNIEDEQLCKKRDIKKLHSIYGNDIHLFLNEDNLETKLKDYDNMPDLHLLTTLMDHDRYQIIKNETKDTKYGFSMDTLFSLHENKKEFNYPNQVQQFLGFISGSLSGYIPDKKSIFERITNISIRTNSRTLLNNASFTTQLWFLPYGIGMKIEDVSVCLKDKIVNDKILNKFEIMIVNSTHNEIKNLKNDIHKKEIEAKENNKQGLIILVGNQCSLGITLPLVDIVFLLNNTISSDKIFQMMYRCMTETSNHSKKNGYVIDFNLSRVLSTMIDYNSNQELNLEDQIKYQIENNLIYLDDDLFYANETKPELINKLLNIWKKEPVNIMKNLMYKLENNIIDINNIDQKLMDSKFNKSTNSKDNITIKLNEENYQELQSGKEITIQNIQSNDDSDDSIKIDIKDKISFNKDILPYIIPFSCILTIKNPTKNFTTMLEIIKNDSHLLNVFNDQTTIWWNHNSLLDFIIDLTKKYIKKNSYTYNIAIQLKMTIESLIDKPKELLDYIESCLKPTDHEKKKYGQVFTPMKLIDEMLDKLDEAYTKINKKSIFTNKDLKWYDPANGMGNYPVAIYFRLMIGLENEIPNKEDRKKHILENMLYMCELLKKDIFICNQIFDVDKKFKLNLYCGDSLTFNPLTYWDIDKFDVIIGNPPYQAVTEEGIVKGGGNNLYTKFIYKANELLKKDGFLVFINPPTFFSIGRSNNKDNMNVRKDIFNKYKWFHINLQECSKYFKVGSKFIYYIIQNKEELNTEIDVICKYNKKIFTSKIDQTLINKCIYLPYLMTNESISISNKIRLIKNKLNIFHSPDNRSDKKHVSKNKDDKYIYPIQSTGSQISYSSIICKNQTNKKVLMSESGYLKPFYDTGINGVGGHCFAYLVKDENEANKIIKLLNSNIYKFYIDIHKWSGFHHIKVLQDLPHIEQSELLNTLKLSKDEITFINNLYDK